MFINLLIIVVCLFSVCFIVYVSNIPSSVCGIKGIKSQCADLANVSPIASIAGIRKLVTIFYPMGIDNMPNLLFNSAPSAIDFVFGVWIALYSHYFSGLYNTPLGLRFPFGIVDSSHLSSDTVTLNTLLG
jgi:hypothetical protein